MEKRENGCIRWREGGKKEKKNDIGQRKYEDCLCNTRYRSNWLLWVSFCLIRIFRNTLYLLVYIDKWAIWLECPEKVTCMSMKHIITQFMWYVHFSSIFRAFIISRIVHIAFNFPCSFSFVFFTFCFQLTQMQQLKRSLPAQTITFYISYNPFVHRSFQTNWIIVDHHSIQHGEKNQKNCEQKILYKYLRSL